MARMRYRLALDLGSTSLGWVLIRLMEAGGKLYPVAIIKAGVRIFSDGRNPKDGSSLAVTRRTARAMRRRRDRLLKRKHRMMALLLEHGFFPADIAERKALERLNPYELRARGLDAALAPGEFARALFHINQRRGFKSNRKTDRKDNDSGALKAAISALWQQLDVHGAEGKARTVGELLWRRMQEGQKVIEKKDSDAFDHSRHGVRARYRERRSIRGDGKARIDKSYDLYIDRTMIEAEFDVLWARQSELNPTLFNEEARKDLKDCLLHQRPLKPVKPGRCTLLPEEERAPLALPSQQCFRILQEVNHLRILGAQLQESALTLEQRDRLLDALERNGKRSFTQIKELLGLSGTVRFSLEDDKRQELKGNITSTILAKPEHFGQAWFGFSETKRDDIVTQLLTEESEARLIDWLKTQVDIDEARAERIANVSLPEGYGSLSAKALARLLPELRRDVVTYDKAVQAAGFKHHSNISHAAATGEILPDLPYYGEYLQRHVGFGSGKPEDTQEKRYGKIANPTVHIGLNQVRVVVNAIIKRYGHPSEVIVEVARDLKKNQEQRREDQQQQAKNQKRNERLREDASGILGIAPERVKQADIQKLILWEELGKDAADRKCPYSGRQISGHMLLSDEVEVEHILPFSRTLDDSLNNKTVALRSANRIKDNRTPWEAREDFMCAGWDYDGILQRAESMPRNKRYRFGADGYEKWLREDKDFLARALNDTRHLSRVAREYLSLICPQATRVIPGRMTAMLRAKLGLNDILGLKGEKNRNDHRHHAVDACVIGVTDQGLLQRFAQASASAREKALDRLIEAMPEPWPGYRTHVERAVNRIWVSHKPDHGFEGAMMEGTAYGIRRDGSIVQKRKSDGTEGREISNLIRIAEPSQPQRHGLDGNGRPLPYKGYVGGSNYCIEIVRDEKGRWRGEVISTFKAYQQNSLHGEQRLRHPNMSLSGKPLVMRLMIGDSVRVEDGEQKKVLRVVKIDPSSNVVFSEINEAGDLIRRHKDGNDTFRYINMRGDSLRKNKARRVTVSPMGELHDPGFKG